jgi:hypothetical protein
VPTTKPGETPALTVRFDARGQDGTYEAIWQMKDHEGRLCFPNKDGLKMLITVSFKLYLERRKAADEAAAHKMEG